MAELEVPAGAGGYVQTVCGRVDPASLGPTLMHEHVLCDLTPPGHVAPPGRDGEITLENCWRIRHGWSGENGNCRLKNESEAIAALSDLLATGGQALVELTVSGIDPNPDGLRRISEASGVAIIAGCGFYTEVFRSDGFMDVSVDRLTARMIEDVRRGIGETGICAGIIGEIGCSDTGTDLERRTLLAAIVAQRETGASLNIHPPRDADLTLAIARSIAGHGGDPGRTIISHVDRTIFSRDELFRLADTGCVIEYDFFGIESSYYPFQDIDLPNDAMRLQAVRALIDRGHLSQITLSHDICTRTRLTRYGGHGYGHLFTNVVPVMRRKGFSDEELDILFVATPRRLLTMENV